MTPLVLETAAKRVSLSNLRRWFPDLRVGFNNLMVHRLRSLLTMLGMIFGVAAVVSMLSIGAGARQSAMALIEQLGVNNLIVEAREALDFQAHQKIRRTSPGLTFQDYRVIGANLPQVVASTARKRFTPTKVLPKPQQDIPVVYGVNPSYLGIGGLRVVEGRFFDGGEEDRAASVSVLGAGARSGLFGAADPIGQYVKVDEQWFHVIGVAAPQLSSQTEVAGLPSQDMNNVIYVPLNSAVLRLENSYSWLRDEIDGIYLNLRPNTDIV